MVYGAVKDGRLLVGASEKRRAFGQIRRMQEGVWIERSRLAHLSLCKVKTDHSLGIIWPRNCSPVEVLLEIRLFYFKRDKDGQS